MTQGHLEKIPLPAVRLINDLENRIMSDMVRRIRINGFSTASADWQMTRLQQLGKSEKEIKEWIRIALEQSEAEIDRIFSDEVYEQYMGHERAYKVNGMEQMPFEENKKLQSLIKAVSDQTKVELRNITGSMGFAIQNQGSTNMSYKSLTEFYRTTLDNAIMDIHSGAFDYQTVLMRTINDMTKSGIRSIGYGKRKDRVDVAARRAIMTGFRQVQGKINEQVAEQLGTDSYEVSYHVGARPDHQPWQGKVWTMKQLQEVCGLGTVTGLHGANCYHDYTAFIPGVSVRSYTDRQLKQMLKEENTPKSYNGKEYTTYEALQEQRRMERRMRKTRQDIRLMEEGGADDKSILLKKGKYYGQMQAYQDFSEKMRMPMQKSRIYQDGLKGDFSSKRGYEKAAGLAEEKEAKRKVEEQKKIRQAKFSDRFQEYNNGQKDTITTKRLLNNLNRTRIGRATAEYLMEHREIEIQMCYGIDHLPGVRGEQIGDLIRIYASETKTVQKTAETIIHEITHHRYDISNTQWAECVCFAQEEKHRTGKMTLTGAELRNIIKTVKELYPEYPWR